MCGIGGYWAPKGQSSDILSAMTDIIVHRGPDDSGALFFQTLDKPPLGARPASAVELAFGHRRLSIVDLSPRGHQPMSYQDGRYWITYNGEIYNYPELRDELESLGYRFQSETDTEVILAAYDAWGEECQHRFNGMWAFALYDTEKQKLFLSRDRFGIKPLYYYTAPDGSFYFGSEIKQFTVTPGWQAQLNHQRAYDFLVWGLTDHTDETLFQGVYQLRPGCFAKLDLKTTRLEPRGRIQMHQWYKLQAKPFSAESFLGAADNFDNLFQRAVNLRLRADVTVGSCLSGGLDSSSIVCAINNILKNKGITGQQKTFSACSRVERFDEKKWIDQVVSHTKANAHYVWPELPDLFDLAEEITWHQDEPFGSTSIFAQWNVFALAALEDVTVMLDGQGADEQLAGYHSFLGLRLADLFRQGRFGQLFKEMKATRQLHGYSWKWITLRLAAGILPENVKLVFRKLSGRAYPTPDWLNFSRLKAKPGLVKERTATSVQELSYSQLAASNLQMLLHWEDRDSMAHSIEARVPFLDHRLVEYVLGLPDEYKISNGWTKRVLRAAMNKKIPDVIRDRIDKIGFATPEEVWIREQASTDFRAKLGEAVETSHGIIAPAALDYFDEVVAGTRPFDFTIWRMINFSQWLRVFQVSV